MERKKRLLIPRLLVFFILLLVILSVRVSRAEDKVKLEEVVVTATKIEESVEDVAQDVTVITKKQIESGSYGNISEVVRSVSGLNVFEYGSQGATSSLSLRGSTAEQVLVLIDGKRLNKPSDGQVDLNSFNIPIENIERIEILRGASSALYGADAMGGVINIITKIPDKPVTKLSASYGRFVTRDLSLNTSRKIGEAGFYIALSKEASEGFRTNSHYDIDSVNTKITYDFTKDIRADFNIDYNHKDAGAPGSTTFPTPFASQTDENFFTGLGLKMKDTSLKLYSHDTRIRYINPGIENNTHKNHVGGIDLQHSTTVGKSNLFTGGIELLEEDLDSRDNLYNSNSLGKHSRTRRGVFLQDEASLYEKISLTLGARYDDIGPNRRTSPKSSLLIKLPEQVNLSFSAGRGFRVPTMNELFWPDTGWAAGNPNLKPEKSTEYEGVIQKFFGNTGNVKLVAFEKKSKDLIQWQEISPGRWIPVNIAKTRVRGIETSGGIHLKEADMSLNYTFLDTKDIETKQKIRFTTRHQLKGTTAVYPAKGATVSLEGSYVTNYVVQQGDPRCYFLLDGKLSQKVKPYKDTSAELFIKGKNMLDRHFETVKGYPMQPRQFIAGMSFYF